MHAYLKQHEQRQACRAHKRKIVKPLYVIHYRFFFFLDRREEFVQGNLGIIVINLGEELSFEVNPGINGVVRKAPKLVKGYPLEDANE